MRFAAIADVHSNYLALEAVLADVRAQGISQIVNLGDAASGPLDAARTINLLVECGAVSVRGNHDRYLIDRAPDKMGSWDRPAYDQLADRHLEWLGTLPPTRLFNESVFLCHGTPASDETYWLEAVTAERNDDARLRSVDRAGRRWRCASADALRSHASGARGSA